MPWGTSVPSTPPSTAPGWWVLYSLAPVGITSGEAFGTTLVAKVQKLFPTGIATAEAMGTVVARYNQTLTAPSIPSGEAFGGSVTSPGGVTLAPMAIASAQAVGTPSVTPGSVTLLTVGIAAGLMGTPTLTTGNVNVAPSGIATSEAFGSQKVSYQVNGIAGIASQEAFGPIALAYIAKSVGAIASAEAFGSPTVIGPMQPILVAGIASTEAFGGSAALPGAVSVLPMGIGTANAFGTAVLGVGAVSVAPSGITTGEAVGSPNLGTVLQPAGIVSAESVGALTLSTLVGVAPTGIATAEALGSPTVVRGAVGVTGTGIATGEAFGTAVVYAIPTGPKFYDDFEYASPLSTSKWDILYTESLGTGYIGSGVLYAAPQPMSDTTYGTIAIQPQDSATGNPITAAPAFQLVSFTYGPGVPLLFTVGLRADISGENSVDISFSAFAGIQIGTPYDSYATIGDGAGAALTLVDAASLAPYFVDGALIQFVVSEIGGVATYVVFSDDTPVAWYDDYSNYGSNAAVNKYVRFDLTTYLFTGLGITVPFGIRDFSVDDKAPVILYGNIASEEAFGTPTVTGGAQPFRNRWVENTAITSGTAFPTNSMYFNLRGIGAGGGGGSGRYGSSGAIRWGGGGGAGGGFLEKIGLAVSGLGTHGLTYGSAGTFGANQGTNNNNGNAGGAGGDVSFTTSSGLVLTAKGGGGGAGGTATTGAGGTPGTNVVTGTTATTNDAGAAGAASNAGTGTPSAGSNSGNKAGGGGGAGGGLPAANTTRAGSAGGSVTTPSQSGGAGGAAAGAGTNGSALVRGAAGSGGGGSGSATTTGTRAAGSGVGYGAGGAGAGAKQAASTQHAGQGGPAYALVEYTKTQSSRLLSLTGTYSQSSVYSGGSIAATAAGMNNQNAGGSSSNMAGTNSEANAFVKVDLGASYTIDQIVMGYDWNSSMSGGWGPSYGYGLKIQGSTNNSTWTDLVAFTPLLDTVNYADGLVPFDVTGTYRYIRVYNASGYVQATELQVWGQ